MDKAESVQLEELEELPLQTFDELFLDAWWDKDEAENLKMPPPTNFGPLTESDHSDNGKNGEEERSFSTRKYY
uniref:Uncharacterized protein n=1 Tax=Globodera rostochiensis TaxID=31243 RepID=A0A914HBJ6_GLORO